jgi:integrase
LVYHLALPGIPALFRRISRQIFTGYSGSDEFGEPIHPLRLTEWFRRHGKAACIPMGTLHVLRHSAATLALTSGVPVHIVAARLGDDPKTVLSTYAHLPPQSDELAAERVAAALAG